MQRICLPSNSSTLVLVGSRILLLIVVSSVDGESPPSLFCSSHGREQENVEDNKRDTGEHLDKDNTEPTFIH